MGWKIALKGFSACSQKIGNEYMKIVNDINIKSILELFLLPNSNDIFSFPY
jgi:hypothetical protein